MIEKHLILQDPPNITVPVDGLLLPYPLTYFELLNRVRKLICFVFLGFKKFFIRARFLRSFDYLYLKRQCSVSTPIAHSGRPD